MIYLSLGSNLGRRRCRIEEALRELDRRSMTVVRRSSFYRTAPVEVEDQPEFVNLCCRASTKMDPREVLDACLDIEKRLGRRRTTRPKGPRNIDIDLLFYGHRIIDAPGLTVPHPRLGRRAFVLKPLAEIAPGFHDPLTGWSVKELLKRCPDDSRVERIESESDR